MVTSAWVKLRRRSVVWRTASLITQHLHRVSARRLPGRIERGKKREHECQQHDRQHLERVGLRRQLGKEAHRRVPRLAPVTNWKAFTIPWRKNRNSAPMMIPSTIP